ncbi:MAG: 16S rRNA (uracil(1498)-N(3))-methyltransferase [Firmicutes bacterium]|nr:16S rRNA (uracil(1498)-N(3))-methyltransferase [Bacillota bacterium]
MHRFFINKENIKGDLLVVEGEDVKHIKNVLRLNIDDKINVCDGEGSDYLVKISEISKKDIRCNIIKKYDTVKTPLEIVLYQGMPKSSKMDLIIQKTTELGVSKIIPVMTKRTVVKINNKKKEKKKITRWEKIATEAAKQSKRGFIPKVEGIINFKDMINILSKEEDILVPYENENNIGIKRVLKNIEGNKINIIIGPEGGFEEEEIEKLQEINSNIITLGPRILRTETAGFATLAVVMYELGDLGVI